jgi:hypothetical protein
MLLLRSYLVEVEETTSLSWQGTGLEYTVWLESNIASVDFPYSGLYYKPMMIVNDDSTIINKLEASLTDDARVIIYDCHVFIVQATDRVYT